MAKRKVLVGRHRISFTDTDLKRDLSHGLSNLTIILCQVTQVMQFSWELTELDISFIKEGLIKNWQIIDDRWHIWVFKFIVLFSIQVELVFVRKCHR